MQRITSRYVAGVYAIANAFEAVDETNAPNTEPRARGSRLLTLLAALLSAAPLSAIPHALGVASLNVCLYATMSVMLLLTLGAWPLLGARRGSWRHMLAFTLLSSVTSGVVLWLMRATEFNGLPALDGGDAGNHLMLFKLFRQFGNVYESMTVLYALAHWRLAIGGSEVDAFRTIAQITYVVVFSFAIATTLLSARVQLSRRLSRAHAIAGMLLLAPCAYFAALPLIHYFQTDGFISQVFSLVPLCIGLLAYALCTKRVLRLATVIALVAICRFTYVLNLGDIAIMCSVLVALEMLEARGRRIARALLTLTALGLLGAGLIIYKKIYAVARIPGGFQAVPLWPQAIGLLALFVVLCGVLLTQRRFDHPYAAPVTRLTRALAVLCLLPGVFVAVWLCTDEPITYYVQKYSFNASVLASMCAPVLALSAAFTLATRGSTPRAGIAASALVALSVFGTAAIGYASYSYWPGFRERAAPPPYEHLRQQAEPVVWKHIQKTLSAQSSTHTQFGGFLTPYWPESRFTNAQFGLRTLDTVFDGATMETSGYCVFWYAPETMPANIQGRWSGNARATLARLQAGNEHQCESFIPLYAPDRPRSICHRCFHHHTRQISFTDANLEGFHGVEGGPEHYVRWTDGAGRVQFAGSPAEEGRSCALRVETVNRTPFEVWLDGRKIGTNAISPLPPLHSGEPHIATIRSDTFVPAADGHSTDQRQLGVMVSGISLECTDQAGPP